MNNIYKAFNSKLEEGRDKPIITHAEFIRDYLMKRLKIVQKAIDKYEGALTPYAAIILEQAKTDVD